MHFDLIAELQFGLHITVPDTRPAVDRLLFMFCTKNVSAVLELDFV